MTRRDFIRLTNEIIIVRSLPRAMWRRSLSIAGIPADVINECCHRRNVNPALAYLRTQVNVVARPDVPTTLPRMYGVEIECFNAQRPAIIEASRALDLEVLSEAYNHHNDGHYKIVSDASLSGPNTNEVVSSPANDFADLQKVCTALKTAGAKVNKSCGLHVHIDATGLSAADMARVINNYYYLYPLIARGLAPSRLTNTFCRLNSPIAAGEVDTITHTDLMNRQRDRYYAVNLYAYHRHGTIEFRQHQGSINFKKIRNWVLFLESLVEWSREHRLCSEVVSKSDQRVAGLRVDLLRDLTRVNRTLDASVNTEA